jgi:hypothetical protein
MHFFVILVDSYVVFIPVEMWRHIYEAKLVLSYSQTKERTRCTGTLTYGMPGFPCIPYTRYKIMISFCMQVAMHPQGLSVGYKYRSA